MGPGADSDACMPEFSEVRLGGLRPPLDPYNRLQELLRRFSGFVEAVSLRRRLLGFFQEVLRRHFGVLRSMFVYSEALGRFRVF